VISRSGIRQLTDKTEARPGVNGFGPQNSKADVYNEPVVGDHADHGAPPAKLALPRRVARDIRKGKHY